MKNLFLAAIVLATSTIRAQVGIGTNTPNTSAELDVTSTTKGLLPPRMNITERNAISSPATGLVIFNTTTNSLEIKGDSSWTNLVQAGTTAGDMNYWNGTSWVRVPAGNNGQFLSFINGVPTWKPIESKTDVTNHITGKIWMDRNLGATQVATSSTDPDSYGYLYQWGRSTDGHQIRTSGTTTTLSATDTPGNANFISATISPYDWRNGQNSNLWQGVNGINNPCPSGYRVPTEAEWDEERLSWTSNNAAGALASPLKLPIAGMRAENGALANVGMQAFYWSSTISGNYSLYLNFASNGANTMNFYVRAAGYSVRCLKN